MPEPTEAAIDKIIATCDGNLRGAVKALLMVNEQLEAELQHVYAQAVQSVARPGQSALH
ncbi:hypothetical protein [Tardiphaga sp.]|uniref:hypothetical protein n=1 Tax=Tardiphaga sp. TaxID=1926292 RepID=UPI002610BD54|nr:hypothetical protein [Tardiphaga sp.]MDB5616308.1 hypothetical protein [Tardiphaga sp.]